MSTKIMHMAAEILRENANDGEAAVALAIAASVLISRAPLTADESLKDKLLSCAELLSPVCPHCGKPTRYGVESAQNGSGESTK